MDKVLEGRKCSDRYPTGPSVPELKELLISYGLPTSGTKSQLCQRLSEYLEKKEVEKISSGLKNMKINSIPVEMKMLILEKTINNNDIKGFENLCNTNKDFYYICQKNKNYFKFLIWKQKYYFFESCDKSQLKPIYDNYNKYKESLDIMFTRLKMGGMENYLYALNKIVYDPLLIDIIVEYAGVELIKNFFKIRDKNKLEYLLKTYNWDKSLSNYVKEINDRISSLEQERRRLEQKLEEGDRRFENIIRDNDIEDLESMIAEIIENDYYATYPLNLDDTTFLIAWQDESMYTEDEIEEILYVINQYKEKLQIFNKFLN